MALSEKYYTSNNIKVFPCSFRGTFNELEDNSNNKYTFDIEASLNTEFNYVNLPGNSDNSHQSYIIEYREPISYAATSDTSGNSADNAGVLRCSIGGYYFEIYEFTPTANLKLGIKLAEYALNENTEDSADRTRTTKVLCPTKVTESISILDEKEGEVYYFTGVEKLTTTSDTTGFDYILDVTDGDGNILPTSYLPIINHGSGNDSIIIGSLTANASANGVKSLAQGNYVLADGDYSHAEGQGDTEQLVFAGGIGSHAEGFKTQAAANYAHAEGKSTKATGEAAHAAGQDTIAEGAASYAGGLGTTADNDYQTVIGKYNKTEAGEFIVGIGTDSDNQDNALVVNGLTTTISNELKVIKNNAESTQTFLTNESVTTISTATNKISGTTNTIQATSGKGNIIEIGEASTTEYIQQGVIANTTKIKDAAIAIDSGNITLGAANGTTTILGTTVNAKDATVIGAAFKSDRLIDSNGITVLSVDREVSTESKDARLILGGSGSTWLTSGEGTRQFLAKSESDLHTYPQNSNDETIYIASGHAVKIQTQCDGSSDANSADSYLAAKTFTFGRDGHLTCPGDITTGKLNTPDNKYWINIASGTRTKNTCSLNIYTTATSYKEASISYSKGPSEDDKQWTTGVGAGDTDTDRKKFFFYYHATGADNPSGGCKATLAGDGTFSAVKFNISSDRRLKENIEDTKFDAESILDQIKIRDFTWKADKDHKQQVGVIAQELAEIMPEEIKDCFIDTTSAVFSVSESKLVYLLIKAYQEEKSKRIEIENRLNKLEGKD